MKAYLFVGFGMYVGIGALLAWAADSWQMKREIPYAEMPALPLGMLRAGEFASIVLLWPWALSKLIYGVCNLLLAELDAARARKEMYQAVVAYRRRRDEMRRRFPSPPDLRSGRYDRRVR